MAADEFRDVDFGGDFLPELSLPHAFTVVASRVSAVLQKIYSDRFGLTVVGWRLMAILGRHSPLSAKALAETVALDQVTVSRTIDQLVNKRFVSRRTDPADRRRVVLRLSKKGEEVYNQVVPVLAAADRVLISCLTKDEADSLRNLMAQLMQRSAIDFADGSDWQNSVLEAQRPPPKRPSRSVELAMGEQALAIPSKRSRTGSN